MNDLNVNRTLARYRVRWKLALVFEEIKHEPTYHGITHDLTLVGTGMLTNKDVFADSRIVILLAIPSPYRNGKQSVIEVEARQIYSVYSGETACFRLGLEFRQFKGDGLNILKEGLSHCNPLLKRSDYDPYSSTLGAAPSFNSVQNLDLAA